MYFRTLLLLSRFTVTITISITVTVIVSSMYLLEREREMLFRNIATQVGWPATRKHGWSKNHAYT